MDVFITCRTQIAAAERRCGRHIAVIDAPRWTWHPAETRGWIVLERPERYGFNRSRSSHHRLWSILVLHANSSLEGTWYIHAVAELLSALMRFPAGFRHSPAREVEERIRAGGSQACSGSPAVTLTGSWPIHGRYGAAADIALEWGSALQRAQTRMPLIGGESAFEASHAGLTR
jgi:hypothetical protein